MLFAFHISDANVNVVQLAVVVRFLSCIKNVHSLKKNKTKKERSRVCDYDDRQIAISVEYKLIGFSRRLEREDDRHCDEIKRKFILNSYDLCICTDEKRKLTEPCNLRFQHSRSEYTSKAYFWRPKWMRNLCPSKRVIESGGRNCICCIWIVLFLIIE